jgi:hypothetical protein
LSRSFSLVDRTLQRVHRDGEAVAVVEARGRDLVLRATSAPRFARLLDRLEQLAGARIDAGVAEVVGPWEHDPGLVEQEGTQRNAPCSQMKWPG